MSIKYTPVFEQVCETLFHITRDQVSQAILGADRKEIFNYEGLTVGLFMVHLQGGIQTSLVLVVAQLQGEDWVVYLGFTIRLDLAMDYATLSPVTLLYRLVQRFGLPIKIGQKLNYLFLHERIEVTGDELEPAKAIQVINSDKNRFLLNSFVKVDPSRSLIECALVFAFDLDKYLAWVVGEEQHLDTAIEIAPSLRGHMTFWDLITSEGTIVFSAEANLQSGFLFRITSPGYRFEVGFANLHFYIERNRFRLEKLIDIGRYFFTASWAPNRLSIILLDESTRNNLNQISEMERESVVASNTIDLPTPPSIPPNSLLNWIRKHDRSPITLYDSPDEIYLVTTSLFQAIEDKVKTVGSQKSFWDITYSDRAIISRQPKRETDIHPAIHGLLFDCALEKNLEIIREFPIASGKLDFLIQGTLNSGRTIPVCVEFKHAHSEDVLHGLLKQLPQYMHSKGCDYGIYCVLWFKGRYFQQPEFEDTGSLKVLLHKELMRTGLSNIRIIVLDFSLPVPPSKL